MTKKIIILTALFIVIAAGAVFMRWSQAGTEVLWNISGGGTWLFPLVVVSALLDSINPCAFSILLVTIALLLGIGRLRSHILAIGVFYIAGIFAVYLLIGLGILQTLHLFDTPHFMGKLGAVLLITLGALHLLRELIPSFPIAIRIPQRAHSAMAALMERGSLPSAFFLGNLVGICEFPCTGGPYLMILGLLHDHGTYLRGAAYLVLYNIIFVLPLVLILLVVDDKGLIAKTQAWQREHKNAMRFGGGLAMVALGAFILLW